MRLDGSHDPDRLRGIFIIHVVPSVDEVGSHSYFVARNIGCTSTQMGERNRVREQKTTSVVPVVLGLDDFCPDRRDEFSEIKRELFITGGEVSLLNVPPGRTPRGVYDVCCITETDVHPNAKIVRLVGD